jgi:sugar transferase (PEP-CTERM system associated)
MKIFGQHIQFPIVLLLVSEWLLAAAAFAVVVSVLMPPGVVDWHPFLSLLVWPAGYALMVVVSLTAMGLYQGRQRLRAREAMTRVAVALLLTGIFLRLVTWVVPAPSGVVFWAWLLLLSFLLLAAARGLFLSFVDHEIFRRRVLVLGAGDRAASLLSLRRRSDQRGFRIVGFVPAPGDTRVIDDPRVVRPSVTLREYAEEHGVDDVVVAMDDRRQGFPVRELLDCKFSGIRVMDLLAFLERETGKLKVDLANPSWLIFSDGFNSHPFRNAFMRAIDVLAALLLMVIFSPVMLGVAIAILLDDGRPVLYRQQRVGLRGNVFTLYKFRSMVRNAEGQSGAVWADREDSRITRVGNIIRKLRFDELPQLLNVIRGDMSLVGPRPERPEFVEQLSERIPFFHQRHSVKPGITGWAQLRYQYGASEKDSLEKLQYDLYYVKHRSPIFDLMVLLQTMEVVLWGKGAR